MAGAEQLPRRIDAYHERKPIHLDGGENEAQLHEYINDLAERVASLPKSDDTREARSEFNGTLQALRFLLAQLDTDGDTGDERLASINELYQKLRAQYGQLGQASVAASDADGVEGRMEGVWDITPAGAGEAAEHDYDAQLRAEREHFAAELQALEERARERGYPLAMDPEYRAAHDDLDQAERSGESQGLAQRLFELESRLTNLDRNIREHVPTSATTSSSAEREEAAKKPEAEDARAAEGADDVDWDREAGKHGGYRGRSAEPNWDEIAAEYGGYYGEATAATGAEGTERAQTGGEAEPSQPEAGGGGSDVEGVAADATSDAQESEGVEVTPITPPEESDTQWQPPEGYMEHQEGRMDLRERRKNTAEFREWQQAREAHADKTRAYERSLEDYYKEMRTLRFSEAWRLQRTGGKLWRKMTGIKPELSPELQAQRSEMLKATEDYTQKALTVRMNRTPSMEYEPTIEGGVRERVLERLPEAERVTLEQQLSSLSSEEQQQKLAEVRREQVMNRYQRQLANRAFTGSLERQLSAQERAVKEVQWLHRLPESQRTAIEQAHGNERREMVDSAVRAYVRNQLSAEEAHKLGIDTENASAAAWQKAEQRVIENERRWYETKGARVAGRYLGAAAIGGTVGLFTGAGAGVGIGAAAARVTGGMAGGMGGRALFMRTADKGFQRKREGELAEARKEVDTQIAEIEQELKAGAGYLRSERLEQLYETLQAAYKVADTTQKWRIRAMMASVVAGGLVGGMSARAGFDASMVELPDPERAEAADEFDAWAGERGVPPEPESAPEAPPGARAEAVDDARRAEPGELPEAERATPALAEFPNVEELSVPELLELAEAARHFADNGVNDDTSVGRFGLVAVSHALEAKGEAALPEAAAIEANLDGLSDNDLLRIHGSAVQKEMAFGLGGKETAVAQLAHYAAELTGEKVQERGLSFAIDPSKLSAEALASLQETEPPPGEANVAESAAPEAAGDNAGASEARFVAPPIEASDTGFSSFTDEQLRNAIAEERERLSSGNLGEEAPAATEGRLSRLILEENRRASDHGDARVVEEPVALSDPRAAAPDGPEVIDEATELRKPPEAAGGNGEEASRESGALSETAAAEGELTLSEPISISLGEGAGEAQISLRVTGLENLEGYEEAARPRITEEAERTLENLFRNRPDDLAADYAKKLTSDGELRAALANQLSRALEHELKSTPWWDSGDGAGGGAVEITDVSIDDGASGGAEAAAEAGDSATIEQVVATYDATERGVAVERTIALEGIEVSRPGYTGDPLVPEGELRDAAQVVYDRDPQVLGRGGFAAALMEELNTRAAAASQPPITELSVRDVEVYTNPLDHDGAGSGVARVEQAAGSADSGGGATAEVAPADADENVNFTPTGDPEPTPLPAYTVRGGDNFWDVAEGDTRAMRTPTMEQIDPTHRQALIDLARDRINADAGLREELGAFGDSASLLKEGEQLNLHRLDELFADIAAEQGWLAAAAEAGAEAAGEYEYTVTADDYDGVVAILEREHPDIFADLDTSERLAVFGALDQRLQADPSLLTEQLASGDPDVIAAGEKLDLSALVAESERLVARVQAGEALGSRAIAVTGQDVEEAVPVEQVEVAESVSPPTPSPESPVTYQTPELPLPASGNLYQTPEWQEYVGIKFGSREAFAEQLAERVMSVEADSYSLLEKPGFLSLLADAEPSDQLEHSAYQAIHDRSVGEFLQIFAEGNEAEFNAVLEEAQQLAATDGRTSNVSAETLRAWGAEIGTIVDTREAGVYYNDSTSVGDLYARYIAETEAGINRAPAGAPTIGELRAEASEAPQINNRLEAQPATEAAAAQFGDKGDVEFDESAASDRPSAKVESTAENQAFSETLGTVEGLDQTERREVLDAYRDGSPQEREVLANMWLGESEVIPGTYTDPFTATLSRQIGGEQMIEAYENGQLLSGDAVTDDSKGERAEDSELSERPETELSDRLADIPGLTEAQRDEIVQEYSMADAARREMLAWIWSDERSQSTEIQYHDPYKVTFITDRPAADSDTITRTVEAIDQNGDGKDGYSRATYTLHPSIPSPEEAKTMALGVRADHVVEQLYASESAFYEELQDYTDSFVHTVPEHGGIFNSEYIGQSIFDQIGDLPVSELDDDRLRELAATNDWSPGYHAQAKAWLEHIQNDLRVNRVIAGGSDMTVKELVARAVTAVENGRISTDDWGAPQTIDPDSLKRDSWTQGYYDEARRERAGG